MLYFEKFSEMYLVLPTGWISEKGEAAYAGSTEGKAGNPAPRHAGPAGGLPGTLSTDANTERCTVGSLLPRRHWS